MKSKSFCLRLPLDVVDYLAEKAESSDVSIQKVIIDILKREMMNEQKEELDLNYKKMNNHLWKRISLLMTLIDERFDECEKRIGEIGKVRSYEN